MEQFSNQVKATREFQWFLNENSEINRIILASYSIYFYCYLFSFLFFHLIKKKEISIEKLDFRSKFYIFDLQSILPISDVDFQLKI